MNRSRDILLAEDSAYDIELTRAALEEYRLANEIVAVNDGEEALDYLYRRGRFHGRAPGNPALILLDLKMPKVDGLEVLRTVRQDADLKAIPAVILTSSRQESDLLRSHELGINAYLVKPVDFQALVEAVKPLGVFWTVHPGSPPDAPRSQD